MGEIEIDLRDFFLRICLEWRKFLAFMLAGAVLVGGVAGIRSYLEVTQMKKTAQMSLDEYEQLQVEKLVKANSKLEEREIVEVRTAFQTYQDAVYSYDAALKYQEDSIKMHLNPNAVPTLNISYYVDNHYEASYPVIDKVNNIDAICNAISDAVGGEEACRKISEKLGWNIENKYVSELISSRSANGILHVTLLASSKEECEEMCDVVSEVIGEQSTNLQETFGDFDVILLEERFDICVNNDLQSIQENQRVYTNNAKSTYESAGSSLNSKQRTSFDALVQLFEIRDKYFVEQSDNADELVEMPEPDYFRLKYIVVGAFAGIVLLGAWVIIKYLSSTKLHVADDMESVYGVDILAVADLRENTARVGKNSKKKRFWFVDELFLRLLGYAHALDEKGASSLAGAEVVATAKKAGMKRVYVASTACTERCRVIQKALCELFEKDLEIAFNKDRVLENSKELKRMVEYDGLVLVEECDESAYKDVKQVVAYCRRNDIPIIGGIVIER